MCTNVRKSYGCTAWLAFRARGTNPYLVPVDGGHDQCVGAEVGPDDLDVLDGLADDVAAVKLGESESPGENS